MAACFKSLSTHFHPQRLLHMMALDPRSLPATPAFIDDLAILCCPACRLCLSSEGSLASLFQQWGSAKYLAVLGNWHEKSVKAA